MTPARGKALYVLRRNHPRAVRVSNATEYGGNEPRIYWQTARWLKANELVVANYDTHAGAEYLSLTDAGLNVKLRRPES